MCGFILKKERQGDPYFIDQAIRETKDKLQYILM
jgi:hypothetical protein